MIFKITVGTYFTDTLYSLDIINIFCYIYIFFLTFILFMKEIIENLFII